MSKRSGKYVSASIKEKNPMRFRVLNAPIHTTDGTVGQCWPGTGEHIIEIDPRQCPKEYLDTLIHESLHELFPKATESRVLRAGTSIANLLWRLGYRRNSARVRLGGSAGRQRAGQ
jgi:hypothetical protein